MSLRKFVVFTVCAAIITHSSMWSMVQVPRVNLASYLPKRAVPTVSTTVRPELLAPQATVNPALLKQIATEVAWSKNPILTNQKMLLAHPELGGVARSQSGMFRATASRLMSRSDDTQSISDAVSPVDVKILELQLDTAVRIGDVESVKSLLAAGVHPEQGRSKGNSLIALAIAKMEYYPIKKFQYDDDIIKLLRHKSQYVEIIKLLLAAGAQPNTQDFIGETLLYLAASVRNVAITKALLNAGADPNIQTGSLTDKQVPLHVAAKDGSFFIADVLLKAGANPNMQDENGETPLHFAADRGQTEMVEALLKAGANPNIPDKHGDTPLSVAILENRDNKEMIDLLIKGGARKTMIYRMYQFIEHFGWVNFLGNLF